MNNEDELVTDGLQGMFRDVLRDRSGRVVWQSAWQKNAIVTDCRRLLPSLLRGAPSATGIRGMQVGKGLTAWDLPPGLPAPNPAQTTLVDPNPFPVPLTNLQMDFLQGPNVTASPTNRLQIVATLGPGMPTWPDGNHADATLREFGLIAQLDGSTVLLNYRTHPAIPKDPASTLERTIWLVF
jgi:hypothetical protein